MANIAKKRKFNTLISCENKQNCVEDGKAQSSQAGFRNWKTLDPGFFKSVLDLLPSCEVFWNFASVCLSWQLASWDYLFWSRKPFVDLNLGQIYYSQAPSDSKVMPGSQSCIFNLPGDYDLRSIKLMKLLKSIPEGAPGNWCKLQQWRFVIHSLRILGGGELEISDEHLLYIAERTPHVSHLYLPGFSRITTAGFAKAFRKWKLLNKITLEDFDDKSFFQVVKGTGRNCSRLESLNIKKEGFCLNVETAFSIIKNLPNILVLVLDHALLDRRGIHAFFFTHARYVFLECSSCFLVEGSDCPPKKILNDMDSVSFGLGIEGNCHGFDWSVGYSRSGRGVAYSQFAEWIPCDSLTQSKVRKWLYSS